MKGKAKALLVLILVTLFSMPSYAVSEWDYEKMNNFNKTRQTITQRIKVDNFANRWARESKGMTEWQLYFDALFAICDITTYDIKSYTPYRILEGGSNCQAYSAMFQKLMYYAGIECLVVFNETHMWNKVKINGEWKKVDVTAFDSFLEGRCLSWQ